MELKKATRKKVKLRLNLSAPSGAGKTFSALRMAYGLVGDWEKIAVIDTENSSASLYEHLGPFNTIDLAAPFSPERYIEAINTCIKAGMECIIIDSSTHEWSGPGGCIDINEKLAAAKYKNNTWSAWNETTPRHDRFVQTVLQAPVHIITCTRSKMETVMGEDKKVKKVGMKDIQRDGWEYELTVSLSIDRDTHMALPSKDRTELFEGLDPFLITEETGRAIAQWCETGVEAPVKTTPPPAQPPVPPAPPALTRDIIKELNACKSMEQLKKVWDSLPKAEKTKHEKLKEQIKLKIDAAAKRLTAATPPSQPVVNHVTSSPVR